MPTNDATTTTPRTPGIHLGSIESGGSSIPAAVYLPHEVSGGTPMPCILFLHGRGECGTDGLRQLTQGVPQAVLNRPDEWPFIVLIPQKPDPSRPWADYHGHLDALIERSVRTLPIDPERLYLTGLSQGGHGVWHYAAHRPGTFAAIAPVCGFQDWPTTPGPRPSPASSTAARLASAITGLPVWAFHGEADTVVTPEHTRAMIAALREAGGSPRATFFPGVGHNAWDPAYRNAHDGLTLASWFLSHRRR
ncbi:MAG: prolyl oligopeptidase family serine peptidase [Phycisphaeraceae bacterium]|nr:MAG: prolyl oligopeptidase family serine peptidase [Phycisphaeraceae bacterium]